MLNELLVCAVCGGGAYANREKLAPYWERFKAMWLGQNDTCLNMLVVCVDKAGQKFEQVTGIKIG